MNHTLDKNSGVLELTVNGDILSTNVDSLRGEIFSVIGQGEADSGGWRSLELDLTTAKMIDSAGLNLIVSVLKNAKQRGATVSAKISSTHIQRTFAFTRLDQQLRVVMV